MKENLQAGTSLGDLFQQSEQQVFRRTDKVFFILFAMQWVAGIIFAMSVSPRAWSGTTSSIHVHVYAAVILGALCCWIPMLFIWKLPGHALTRHVVAIGQTGFSSLLIHLTGGRIETHFHVFGSLAFLACYRDWRVLITATVIVTADHLIRGIWFPMSVYGVLLASPWRVAEHALWVVFEDIILIWSCRVSRREMYAICEKEFQNQQLMGGLEFKVKERTAELESEVQERRRAESTIRANEERYRTLVENSPQFIVKIDRNYKIEFINRTVEGIDREKVMGTSLMDFHTRENQDALRRELDGVFQFGQSRSVEVTGPGPSGTVAWYSMNLAPLHTDGRITGAIILATDVTDRRNAEEEMMRARDSAEAGNRAKSEFLAIMSHELRTPLNGVLGFADLLMATPLNTEQREFAGTIRGSGETLLGIINDILDLSKIESGKMDYDIAEVNIREIVEEVTELLMPRAEEKGLELCLWHNPDAPSIIHTDQGRFRQVLLNLVGNAIKFTETGHVLVEIENEGSQESPQLRIGIRDTGIGIPRDKQHLLFQKFSQVDGSSTRKFGGAGLGLAICKQLIEGLSGSIGVESAPGHGSHFWFTHPVGAAALGNPPLPTVPASIDGLRILIVDDLEINRRVLQQQLRRWNIRFETASSGPLGLELLQRAAAANEPFQIALVDHLMPHMDGVMFGQRVKADPAIAETALIMLTSGAQRGEAREMLNHGFAAYLCKPVVRARQLLDSITTVWANLNQARAATPSVENVPAPVTNKILYRVLLAEDNPVNLRVASLHLKRLGCDVICVTNGREAIEQFKKIAFDCVFMDLLMPEIDGLEATKIMRALPNGSDTLIVAVTANAMSGDRENCLAAGMDDYISKPIRVEELQRVLSRCGVSEVASGM